MNAAPFKVEQAPELLPARRAAVARTDLVPSLGVLGVVAVLGLPLGVLWSWLAPPEFVVRSPRAAAPGGVLPFVGQTEHRFDDMATFLLLGLAAGVLTGAALWLFRRRRGPLVLVAAVLGALVAGWLAMRAGLWMAAAYYPDLTSSGAPFPRPPVLESSWVIIGQPFGVAVAYCITTAWNRAEDLGTAS
jgi:LPXTG-motif cell wall-anchored protein